MRPTTLGDKAISALAFGLFLVGCALVAFDFPQWVDDLARAVVLAECVALMLMSVLIVRVYWRNFKLARAQARLLPRHVIQLGLLLSLLVFNDAARTIDLVGTEPRWYGLPVLLPGLTIGILGLVDMIKWLPDRRNNIRPDGDRRMG